MPIIPTEREAIADAVTTAFDTRFGKTAFSPIVHVHTPYEPQAMLFSDEVMIQFSDDTLIEW